MKRAEIEAKMNQFYADAARITDKAKAENRDITDAELLAVESACDEGKKAKDELAAFDARAARLERAMAGTGRKTQPDEIKQETAKISTHDRVLDDKNRGFTNLGEFAQSVKGVSHGARDERLLIQAAAGDGLSAGVATDGGFLMPPAFSTSIYEGLTTQADSIMEACDRYTIPAGVESITFPADAETSRADGSRAGGIQGYWKAELTQLTSSKPTLREIKLEPHELYVFAYIADKLLANAPLASQWLQRKMQDEIKFKINNAIINGTGAGQPKGVMASAARVNVAKEAGQAADTIVRQNIQKMWQRTLPQSQSRGQWFYDSSCLQQLSSVTLDVGTGGVPVFMPPGGLSGAPYGTIFGRPARALEYCSAIGDNGDLIFADLGAYALATRGGMDTQMSMHLKFDYAQSCFRTIFEVDGQPWLASAITPYSPPGSTTKTETLSAFTAIAARA